MPSRRPPPVIVIDVANLGSVDNLTKNFSSLKNHLSLGRVHVASGGKKFKDELKRSGKFLTLFNELSRNNYVIKINDCTANLEVNNFKNIILSEFGRELSECDDPHLFALCKLANSKIIISTDKRICSCRRMLRKSQINNNAFSNPKMLKSNKAYLKCYNNKTL